VSSARRELLDLILSERAFEHSAEELLPMRLAAAQEVFAERRAKIPVLARRADETGISDIRKFEDIVPLLFAHTVYKSYPPALIEKGRWDTMNQWLSTLSTDDFSEVDVSGVENADEWIARLAAHGTIVLATSGTSGKCSFLPYRTSDRALKYRQFRHTVNWPEPPPKNEWLVFWSAPIVGPSSVVEGGQFLREAYARPDGFRYFLKDPLLISEVSAMGIFNKRLADGLATPTEIAEMERKGRDKAERAQRDFATFVDELLTHHREPLALSGLWSQFMQMIERARELGIPDNDWHPRSRISVGGGVKAAALPSDYKDRYERFFGNVVKPGVYSMTEVSQLMPRCGSRRYHIPPALIPLLLDRTGENLLQSTDGVVEGRFAFLDLLFEGRWGGVITGDKVEMDFSPRCPCGRPGPTILDSIARFSQLGEEDHIGCAGTIDSYVRGVMAS
jgi:hypothetical protein